MAKKGNTDDFLRVMNARNEAIAKDNAEKREAGRVGEDEFRIKSDAERRERYGQLRARPKNRRKGRAVHHIFGYTDLSS